MERYSRFRTSLHASFRSIPQEFAAEKGDSAAGESDTSKEGVEMS
jgi:hypothetical protein